MGPLLRAASAWVAATVLIVAGVDAAIEQVARDVSITRPAPMTPGQVEERLDLGPSTTGTDSTPTDSGPASETIDAATTTPAVTAPSTPHSPVPPTTIEPGGPETTRATVGRPADVGTTIAPNGSSGRSDEREEPPSP